MFYSNDLMVSRVFVPLPCSYHPVLYIQMSNPKDQKGNRGAARAKAGSEEIRQHIRDSATSERADRDPRM